MSSTIADILEAGHLIAVLFEVNQGVAWKLSRRPGRGTVGRPPGAHRPRDGWRGGCMPRRLATTLASDGMLSLNRVRSLPIREGVRSR